MKRVSASGVHTTRGDYRSLGIERVVVYKVVDGHILRWRHPLYHRWETILERAAWKTPSAMGQAKTGPRYLSMKANVKRTVEATASPPDFAGTKRARRAALEQLRKRW